MHLFTSMDPVVSREVTLLGETSLTDSTLVWSLTRVCPTMDSQQAFVFEALVTLRTLVFHPSSVRSMSRRFITVLFVFLLVSMQSNDCHEALVTNRTLVWFLGVVCPLVNDQTATL